MVGWLEFTSSPDSIIVSHIPLFLVTHLHEINLRMVILFLS